MKFNVREVEHNIRRIENIDSGISVNTQRVIQEIARKYANMKEVKTKKITNVKHASEWLPFWAS